jgi:hypothetical protein
MSNLTSIAARVAAGATVEFRPTGSSMVPLIRSRQLVTVAPVDPAEVTSCWHAWRTPSTRSGLDAHRPSGSPARATHQAE